MNGTLCVLPTHGAPGMVRIATWAAQTLRHHVALVSPPLGYVALEQLAKLFPTTVATLTDGPAFSVLEKRAALLTAALSFPELLQVRDAGRHTAIRATNGHCPAIAALLDTSSLPAMMGQRAPKWLAFACSSSTQRRIWREGGQVQADAEDGRYIWFYPLSPMLSAGSSGLPSVVYFLCSSAVRSGVKVFRMPNGACYTLGINGSLSKRLASIPPFRSRDSQRE